MCHENYPLASITAAPRTALSDKQVVLFVDDEPARRIRKGYGSSIPIISCSGSFSLPPGMPEIVDASLEKGAGPLALINIVKSATARPNRIPDDAPSGALGELPLGHSQPKVQTR